MNLMGKSLNGARTAGVVLALGLAALLSSGSCGTRRSGALPESSERPPRVMTGIEILARDPGFLKGKKAGLITNPSGVDGNLNSSIEIVRRLPEVKLVALYAPEHGVRGDAQAGEYIPFYRDEKYGLPVFSLYGPSQKPQPGMLKDIDAFMRSFDTTAEDKKLAAPMTEDIDVLLFDVQDVGTRVYTYAATMAYAMETCAAAGIPFVVLDRPNPINGLGLEGPILEYPAFSSFIGLYPIPLRFGMTVGELAGLINGRFLEKKVELTVVKMEGWSRGMAFEETGLPWVTPSPNIPTVETAVVYPGQVLIEGTNVSEGRGTTHPFEFFGAPWIDGFELTARLNGLNLPGVKFREQWFTPTFSKYRGERCGGSQIHVTDRSSYRPIETALRIIAAIKALYPDRFSFHDDYFDKVCGTAAVRESLLRGQDVTEIVRGFEPGLKDFEALRKPYLLY